MILFPFRFGQTVRDGGKERSSRPVRIVQYVRLIAHPDFAQHEVMSISRGNANSLSSEVAKWLHFDSGNARQD